MALNKTWQNLNSTTEPARCAVLFNIRISLSLFLLALASSSYCAEISDSVIKLDAQTSATYSEPKIDPPEACVLMIHGWTSTMDEVGGLYKSLATRLAEAGLASLRVQIPGESRALGNRLTSRFDERVASSTLALEYLSTRCSDKKIGLVGFSLGGATAMVLAGNYPERIHSLVLWSSATDPSQVEQRLLTPIQVDAIMTQGEVAIETYQEFVFTKRHLLGLRGHSQILENLSAYSNPLLLLRGSEDFLENRDNQILQAAGSKHAESRIIKGADHIFNVLNPAESNGALLLEYTSKQLNITLVD